MACHRGHGNRVGLGHLVHVLWLEFDRCSDQYPGVHRAYARDCAFGLAGRWVDGAALLVTPQRLRSLKPSATLELASGCGFGRFVLEISQTRPGMDSDITERPSRRKPAPSREQ